jgi:hypothetical protein
LRGSDGRYVASRTTTNYYKIVTHFYIFNRVAKVPRIWIMKRSFSRRKAKTGRKTKS